MELDQQHNAKEPAKEPAAASAPKKTPAAVMGVLNVLVLCMLAAAAYFGYAYISRTPPAPDPAPVGVKPPKVIQLDVLNGCGAKGAGAKFTAFLRNSGFDVVEMKNYKTFNVAQTLVIDRIGDLSQARRVAAALGVAEKNVVQQINPDYFVDVSVVIGGDYGSLLVGRQEKKETR